MRRIQSCAILAAPDEIVESVSGSFIHVPWRGARRRLYQCQSVRYRESAWCQRLALWSRLKSYWGNLLYSLLLNCQQLPAGESCSPPAFDRWSDKRTCSSDSMSLAGFLIKERLVAAESFKTSQLLVLPVKIQRFPSDTLVKCRRG